MTDGELTAHLAEVAGRILLDVRASDLFGPKALGVAGDQTANQFLVHALREQRPEDGLLSEESRCDGERLGKRRVWIVDPVDGTREYGEKRADWAVHVGLAVDGVATVGAVALPDLDRAPVGPRLAASSFRRRSAADGGEPHPSGRRGDRGGGAPRGGTGAHGLGRSEGDGRRARRGGHLPPFRRAI